MNSASENDLELLESYLDDELTGRELEALRQRLSSEPQLAVAIDELKSQRQMRQQFFNQIAGPVMNKMFECGMIP